MSNHHPFMLVAVRKALGSPKRFTILMGESQLFRGEIKQELKHEHFQVLLTDRLTFPNKEGEPVYEEGYYDVSLNRITP